MATKFTPYLDQMNKIIGETIIELDPVVGGLPALINDNSLANQLKATNFELKVRTKGQWGGRFYKIGATTGQPQTVAFETTKWTPSFYHDVCEFEKWGVMMTSNPASSVTRQDVDTIYNMVTNSKTKIGYMLYGVQGDYAKISGTTSDAYAAGIMTFADVGEHLSAYPLQYSGSVRLREGMVVDILDRTTYLPLAATTGTAIGLTVTGVQYDPGGGPISISVSGSPAAISGHAAGDYFVEHGAIAADGSTDYPIGISGIFSMQNTYTAGNPTEAVSMPSRLIGGVDASAKAWWNAYVYSAASTAANNSTAIMNCIDWVNHWRTQGDVGANIMMAHPTAAWKIADSLDAGTNYIFTNTQQRFGGFTSVNYSFGKYTNEILMDSDLPQRRAYIFNKGAIKYTVLQPLTLGDPVDMDAFGQFKTVVPASMSMCVVVTDRRQCALAMDLG